MASVTGAARAGRTRAFSGRCRCRDVNSVILKQQNTGALDVNFLRNRARRCKICLQTLPIGFTKRRENSTFYSNK
ncbi:hypothetical protein E2320_010449 [Naja naja]|nr:hypothetical protein E2320_010449 [Naja naja]